MAVKAYTVYVRGVSKDMKNALKRLAKDKKWSVSSYMLTKINEMTAEEIERFKKFKKQ